MEANYVIFWLLFSKELGQDVIVSATVRTLMRFSLCPDLIFEGGTPEQTATLWTVASVHGNNISLDGLSSSNIKLEVFEP